MNNENQERNPTPHWYDYAAQKAIKLPPVGAECEVYGALGKFNEWQKCTIMAVHKDTVFVCDENRWNTRSMSEVKLRPLDWNRKAEQEKEAVVSKALQFWFEHPESSTPTMYAMYDAGFLKMPEEK